MTQEDSTATNTHIETLAGRYKRAVALTESSPGEAAELLESVQSQVSQLSLFSKNECLADISTGSLPFLALEHYLAVSLVNLPLPLSSLSEVSKRQEHLLLACDMWIAFLQRLEGLELLSSNEKQQFEDLIELFSSYSESSDGGGAALSPSFHPQPPPVNRDVKIARFRAKQEMEKDQQRLISFMDRRKRLDLREEDEMDGFDGDGLGRSVALATLQINKADALDEFSSVLRELPMITMMVRAQQERQGQDRYHSAPRNDESASVRSRPPPPNSNKPLQVTHITQDAATGQLRIKREEIRSQVFRPGWNQPTMSLDELAEREVRDATEREQRQREAEAAEKQAPRRYELLKKDGMEDQIDLVDASASLDRRWDDWKDENPRGSGNKRGDVGDRNF